MRYRRGREQKVFLKRKNKTLVFVANISRQKRIGVVKMDSKAVVSNLTQK